MISIVKHILLGGILILAGIGIIRWMIKEPDFFGVLSHNRFGCILLGCGLILAGIIELFKLVIE